jgi:hypothetical protein
MSLKWKSHLSKTTTLLSIEKANSIQLFVLQWIKTYQVEESDRDPVIE